MQLILRTADEMADELHDAEIELSTVMCSDAGVEFSGFLYAYVDGRRWLTPGKFAFRARFEGATEVVVSDPDGVGQLMVCDVDFDADQSKLVIDGCIPGQISVSTSSPILIVDREPGPFAVRSWFRWKSINT